MAQAAAVSRSGLDAHFRAELGLTVRAVIRRIQLERTLRLVTDTGLSLKEIAARTGFQSVQHMTTLFSAAYGRPPARYRGEANRSAVPRQG